MNLGDEGSFAGTSFQPAQHAVFSYVRVISPRIVNEFRVGFNRFRVDYMADQYEPGAALGNKFGFANSNVTPNEQNFPIFSPSNYFGIGQTRSLPIFRRENTFQYMDNMSMTVGQAHAEVGRRFPPPPAHHLSDQPGQRPVQLLARLHGFPATGGPAATPWRVSCSAIRPPPCTTTPSTGRASAASRSALYFADDWRVTRKLTLNLGLRWDYYSPFSEVANRWANFNVDTAKIDIAGQERRGQIRRREAVLQELRTALRIRLSAVAAHRASRRLSGSSTIRPATKAAACVCSGSFRSARPSPSPRATSTWAPA